MFSIEWTLTSVQYLYLYLCLCLYRVYVYIYVYVYVYVYICEMSILNMHAYSQRDMPATAVCIAGGTRESLSLRRIQEPPLLDIVS